jgi:hypothetical protein
MRPSGDLGVLVRPLVVAVLAVVTAVVAYAAAAGRMPAPGTVALAGVVAAVGVAALGLRRAAPPAPLVGVLVGQLVCHAVFAISQPVGCLKAVGHAAWAGAALAHWGASGNCAPNELLATGTPLQLTLLVVVSVVPLLLIHAVAAALSAAGINRAEDAVRCAFGLLDGVLTLIPRAVQLPVIPACPVPSPGRERLPRPQLVMLQPLVRRGPPLACA